MHSFGFQCLVGQEKVIQLDPSCRLQVLEGTDFVFFQHPIGHETVIHLDPSNRSQVTEGSDFVVLIFNVQFNMTQSSY